MPSRTVRKTGVAADTAGDERRNAHTVQYQLRTTLLRSRNYQDLALPDRRAKAWQAE